MLDCRRLIPISHPVSREYKLQNCQVKFAHSPRTITSGFLKYTTCKAAKTILGGNSCIFLNNSLSESGFSRPYSTENSGDFLEVFRTLSRASHSDHIFRSPCSDFRRCTKARFPYNLSDLLEGRLGMDTFLGNCLPTPPLSQYFALSEN